MVASIFVPLLAAGVWLAVASWAAAVVLGVAQLVRYALSEGGQEGWIRCLTGLAGCTGALVGVAIGDPESVVDAPVAVGSTWVYSVPPSVAVVPQDSRLSP